MSYFEMSLIVECPHCGKKSEHAGFNMGEADECGVNSGYYEVNCHECFKDFWFKACCYFDTEATDVFKKKPKDLK